MGAMADRNIPPDKRVRGSPTNVKRNMTQAPLSSQLPSTEDVITSGSTQCSPKKKRYKVCLLKFGEVYEYTIPSVSVITVTLRHTVIQALDDNQEPIVLDAFFRDDPSLDVQLPLEAIVTEACIVDVSL